MKKTTALFFLIVLLFLLLSGSPVHGDAQGVLIYNFEGKNVSLSRNGRDVRLTPDMKCEKGDVVKTGADSSMDLACYYSAGCRLGPFSECVIVSAYESSVELLLKSGTALVKMRTLQGNFKFEIGTPVATASVRSDTQFWMKAYSDKDGKPAATFSLRQGALSVRADLSGASVYVPEAYSVDVTKDTFVPVRRPNTAEEAKALQEASSVLIAVPD